MVWNVDPIIAQLGFLELRWYGLFFATGLLFCAFKAPKYFDIWGLPREHAERLALWVPIGMLLGAHYVHLAFYETEDLFDMSIQFSPFKVGRFWALGSGLASHGGGLGCFLSLTLFWWLNGKDLDIRLHRYLDAVMVTSIWVYPFVRLGNFFNSEIYGRITDGPWGVIFPRGYGAGPMPRHPQQLYEAAMNFVLLGFALWFQKKYANKLRSGVTFYLLIGMYATFRFVAEFTKDDSAVGGAQYNAAGHHELFTGGQWLSLPIIILAFVMLVLTRKYNIFRPLTDAEKAENETVLKRAAKRDADAEKAHQALIAAAGKSSSKP